MYNMSYCRFENTLGALQECIDALEDRNISSSSEKRKAKTLLETMAEFLVGEDLINTDENGNININYAGIEEFISECKDNDD